jgi:sugar lactone lactonase YvrE
MLRESENERMPSLMKRSLFYAGNLCLFLFASTSSLYSYPYPFVPIAGNPPQYGTADGTNDTARFRGVGGIAADSAGNLYVADTGGNSIRRLAPVPSGWAVTTLAGTPPFLGYADGTNNSAKFSSPMGIVVAPAGELYVTDYSNSSIRKLTPQGTNWVVTTLALTGDPLTLPRGLARDAAGNLYVTDYFNETVCRVAPSGTNWVVKILAGVVHGFGSVDGINSDARFAAPCGIAVDAAGNLYVGENYSATIRKVAPRGTNWVVTTIAGAIKSLGTRDGTNDQAQFWGPEGIAVNRDGVLFVVDAPSNLIRKVTPVGSDWVVTTLGSIGNPYDVTIGERGNIYATAQYAVYSGQEYYPPLHVARSGQELVLSWPTVAQDFTLESSASLAATANWEAFSNSAVISGSNCMLTNEMTGPTRFYRLRR